MTARNSMKGTDGMTATLPDEELAVIEARHREDGGRWNWKGTSALFTSFQQAHADRRTLLAALRAERTAPLDVERLARAQLRAGIDTFRPRDDKWISANEAQAAIAAEYARLAPATGEGAE